LDKVNIATYSGYRTDRLAVMGQNLILNMNDHGFKVIAYNRTVSKWMNF